MGQRNQQWAREERELWDKVMEPLAREPLIVEYKNQKLRFAGRRPLCGVTERKLRNAIIVAVQKRRKDELAAGWRAWRDWITH